jgi:hypothetical protein
LAGFVSSLSKFQYSKHLVTDVAKNILRTCGVDPAAEVLCTSIQDVVDGAARLTGRRLGVLDLPDEVAPKQHYSHVRMVFAADCRHNVGAFAE